MRLLMTLIHHHRRRRWRTVGFGQPVGMVKLPLQFVKSSIQCRTCGSGRTRCERVTDAAVFHGGQANGADSLPAVALGVCRYVPDRSPCPICYEACSAMSYRLRA